jgi:hypothetical protein
MNAEEILELLRHRPFQAFRIVTTDGTSYEIRHPELAMVGKRSITVGLTADPSQPLYDRTVIIALLHVQRLEPVPALQAS